MRLRVLKTDRRVEIEDETRVFLESLSFKMEMRAFGTLKKKVASRKIW